MIKGILFDFDGTLANTIDLIVDNFERTIKKRLGFVPARQEIIDTIGLPLADALAMLSGHPELTDELRELYGYYNNENHDSMIRPIAGVAEMLAALREQGYKLAVVTSKKPHMLSRGLRCLDMQEYFATCVTVLDTAQGKPHPAPMLLACERLGLAPEECLCVGDSPYDMQSGNAAGNVTVAVEYTALDWEKLLQVGQPRYTIAQPEDLLALLGKINS